MEEELSGIMLMYKLLVSNSCQKAQRFMHSWCTLTANYDSSPNITITRSWNIYLPIHDITRLHIAGLYIDWLHHSHIHRIQKHTCKENRWITFDQVGRVNEWWYGFKLVICILKSNSLNNNDIILLTIISVIYSDSKLYRCCLCDVDIGWLLLLD